MNTTTTQTITRAEIAMIAHLFKTGDISPITNTTAPTLHREPTATAPTLHQEPTATAPTLDNLAILIAHITDHPLDEQHRPELKASCGRFALVEYTPYNHKDPEIIVYLGRRATAYHHAIANFQDARSLVHKGTDRSKYLSSQGWYTNAKNAALNLIQPLRKLGATRREFLFVMHWALLCCTYRRTT